MLSGVSINALGVAVVAHGDFGISAISSFPYSLHGAFPIYSFGVWTYLFQITLILVLICLTKRADVQYALAFVVSIFYGYLLDGIELLTAHFPSGFLFRCGCYAIGTVVMAVGTCLAIESGLPVLPHDIFLRELSKLRGWKFQYIKTAFDCTCVLGGCALGLIVNQGITGIGIGTFISAAVMGKCIHISRRGLVRAGIIRPPATPEDAPPLGHKEVLP